jgi:hypothetical protein
MDHVAAIDIGSAFGSTGHPTTWIRRRTSASPVAETAEASCRGPPSAAVASRPRRCRRSERCVGTIPGQTLTGSGVSGPV